MSDLDYSISVLQSEASKISQWLGMTGDQQTQRLNQLDGISKAVNILSAEKIKEEKEI